MSLYEGAVKKPIMTSLCFLAVAIFGLFSLSKLPVDLYPDIETNTIMVMTTYQGASASDIENNVTRPLENVLNSVSNLKHITSRSSENISVITLEFEYGYDIDVLTNDVRDKLDMVIINIGEINPADRENIRSETLISQTFLCLGHLNGIHIKSRQMTFAIQARFTICFRSMQMSMAGIISIRAEIRKTRMYISQLPVLKSGMLQAEILIFSMMK